MAPADHTYITNHSRLRGALAGGRVLVTEGKDASREIKILPGTSITVGSGTECELQLDDRRVSRHHLQIMLESTGFRVRDLGSSNGTYLGGSRIEDVVVQVGAILTLGKTSLQLLSDGAGSYFKVPPSTHTSFGRLIGRSVLMREVFGVLERVRESTVSVLIEGATGTGKELSARTLHEEGPRAAGPFIAIDCGAIPPNVVESELFGHVRGAFTGATDTRTGAFERADGGTLFLDEVGELPSHLQPKLLRVLESHEVRKVGADEGRKIDLRVVAGTNRDLNELVLKGEFRSDLYYRLAVVHIVLPSMRTRMEDIPALVERFLRDEGVQEPGPIDGPNLDLLASHNWPGNVRELRNVIHRAIATAGPQTPFGELPIQLPTRPATTTEGGRRIDIDVPFSVAKEQLIEEFEREYLTALLRATEGNIAEAARRCGVNRRHLYDLLAKYGLRG